MSFTALTVSTLAVAVAEIGDKTQLLALVLAARYRAPWPIIAGIFVATLANHGLAGWFGALAAQWISPELARWLIAASFLAVAVWALIPDKLDADEAKAPRFGPFLATLIAFFLVEIGDKTQIATVVLAAQYEPLWQVVMGTTIGMLLANVPVVLLGSRFAAKLPLKAARWASAVLFAGLAVWVLLRPGGETGEVVPESSAAMEVVSLAGAPPTNASPGSATGNPTPSRTEASPARPEPLPPADTPLLGILLELESRLAAGDGRAGCRLARELRRCHQLSFGDPTTQYLIDTAAQLPEDDPSAQAMANSAVRIETNREIARTVCEGITPAHIDRRFDYLLRAAEAGHLLSMAEFADGQGFNQSEFVLHPERLIQYRDRAPGMLRAALAAGSPEAAVFLWMALQDDMSFLGTLIPDDPVEAHAMRLLLHRIGVVNTVRPPRQPITPQQEAAAEARAETLRREHFAQFAPRPLHRSSIGGMYDSDAAACEE